MGTPKLSNARVLLETASSEPQTRVISVSWELSDDKHYREVDGEWSVLWNDMYSELSDDIRSARSEQGGYFALQQPREAGGDRSGSIGALNATDTHKESFGSSTCNSIHEQSTPDFSVQDATPIVKQYITPVSATSINGILDLADEPLPTGPLSTARLLEFENGANFHELQEDLHAFFSSRPMVQAPAQIQPDITSVSKKTEVFFLLAPTTAVPQAIKIFFTPTWTPPCTPPTLLTEIRACEYGPGEGLHTSWASKRLEDLHTLQEIARELEREGSRGMGQGRVKVGVEGGGMDEEAVRREGWMVGEEQAWVMETYLLSDEPSEAQNSEDQSPEQPHHNSVMDPFLAGLGISTGMRLDVGSTVFTPSGLSPLQQQQQDVDEEEDLFALPLSPRSPDMAMSPFSMFRGEALGMGGSPQPPSKLRMVESIDHSVEGAMGAPLTPPRETRV
jgi:hypothetical protein